MLACPTLDGARRRAGEHGVHDVQQRRGEKCAWTLTLLVGWGGKAMAAAEGVGSCGAACGCSIEKGSSQYHQGLVRDGRDRPAARYMGGSYGHGSGPIQHPNLKSTSISLTILIDGSHRLQPAALGIQQGGGGRGGGGVEANR